MNEEIDKAVKVLTAKITSSVESADALRFTQAALNLAHVKEVMSELDKIQGELKGRI